MVMFNLQSSTIHVMNAYTKDLGVLRGIQALSSMLHVV